MYAIVLVVLVFGVLPAFLIWNARHIPSARPVTFSTTLTSARSIDESRTWAVTSFATALRDARYQLVTQAERQLSFTRTYRSGLTWLATILLFPIGLIFFFANGRTANITMLFSETSDGSKVLISGTAPQRLVAQIEAA